MEDMDIDSPNTEPPTPTPDESDLMDFGEFVEGLARVGVWKFVSQREIGQDTCTTRARALARVLARAGSGRGRAEKGRVRGRSIHTQGKAIRKL